MATVKYNNMYIIGARVNHITLGSGIVRAVKKNRIIIRFDSSERDYEFAYPEALDRGLISVENMGDALPCNISVMPVGLGRRSWNGDVNGYHDPDFEKLKRSLNAARRRRRDS